MPRLPCGPILLLLCSIALSACASAPGQGSDRVALVLGNGAYDNVPDLTNPLNDAADMCVALGRIGFDTLCYTNVRHSAEFDERVREYVDKLRPDSIGVFYYAGHGVQAHGANFMIPTEVQLRSATEDPLQGLYGLDTLFERLRQKPTQFQFIILDACRTDLFAAPQASGRGTTQSDLVRSLATVARASNGLARITDAPPATMVLYATASEDAAFDGDGRNGPLTKHILRHIGTKGLPLDEFIRRVTSGVENETTRDYQKRQTPFIYGSFTGRFCFAGCPGESVVPPAF